MRPLHEPGRGLTTRACPYAAVVACGALEAEVEGVLRLLGCPDLRSIYLPHALHATPGVLTGRLQEALAELEETLPEGAPVFLAYGECGGAVDRVASRRLRLVRAACSDCIPLAVGDAAAHRRLLAEEPGTYFFTPAWVRAGENPLSKFRENEARFGSADARMIHDALFRHYRRFVYVEPARGPDPQARAFTAEAAQRFGVTCSVVQGSLALLRAYLEGAEHGVPVPPAAGGEARE